MSAGQVASRAGELERRYLSGTFAELCRIESPSGRERACADRVIAELAALDVPVREDGSGALVGSDCGNLHAYVPAGSGGEDAPVQDRRPSLLLCAHLDTVPLQAPVEPVLLDGYWENANDGILGADNKAAIAVILTLARHVRRAGGPVDLELLFTVGEEVALAGARAFDASSLTSEFGYVFDHASPIGEVITSSPSHFRLDVAFHGVAAHAGIRPEDGRSAIRAAARAIASMPHGRLDEQTTVNVGTISGGTAMNVVPERCTFVAEVRSLDDERARSVTAEVVDRVHEAANRPECDVDVDVTVERTFGGYRLSGSRPAVRVAEAALSARGHEPVRVASGGASDANALIAQGFEMVNLANQTERNHEPGERVSVLALEEMLEVAFALLDQTAALSR
ncbi:MAG TPA: M20/M25/M40 family metallo-hydrolase [Solirubrobacteraceae bacterium]|nr:M20/M25/M40 family metallo-hydrolase [Solirubrobacteraceae bacterium]